MRQRTSGLPVCDIHPDALAYVRIITHDGGTVTLCRDSFETVCRRLEEKGTSILRFTERVIIWNTKARKWGKSFVAA